MPSSPSWLKRKVIVTSVDRQSCHIKTHLTSSKYMSQGLILPGYQRRGGKRLQGWPLYHVEVSQNWLPEPHLDSEQGLEWDNLPTHMQRALLLQRNDSPKFLKPAVMTNRLRKPSTWCTTLTLLFSFNLNHATQSKMQSGFMKENHV